MDPALPPRAGLADDERLMREQLRARLAEAWPELQIVAEARNGLEAVELVMQQRPDVVFLDIRMPGLTGVEAARRIAQLEIDADDRLPEIVFVTAYDQYAIEAFEQGAADYVLKPVERARLEGLGEQVAERLVALELAQNRELCLRLDALGDDGQPEGVGEVDDGGHDRRRRPVGRQPGHERPVDLQDVERQPLEVGELRPTGAEVVDAEADADTAQLVELLGCRMRVVHEGRLGDLHADLVGGDPHLPDRPLDMGDEVGIAELAGRQVHPDPHGLLFGRAVHPPPLGLPAGLGDHPPADVDDDPGLLGQGDELAGRDETAVGPLPAHERLEADDPSRGEVELRLVVEAQFLVVDGPPQRLLRVDALEGEALVDLVVDREPAATLVLRLVHRGVGVLEDPVGVVVADGRGDPDRRPDADLASVEDERLVEGPEDPARDRGGASGPVGAGAQHHELVAPDAGEGVAGADDGGEALRHLAEHRVARGAPQGVVDGGEAVEVDEQHADRLQRPAADGERVGEPVEQQRPVGQPGELVVERLFDQALFGLALLGDVAARVLELPDAPVGCEDRGQGGLEPAERTVAVPQPLPEPRRLGTPPTRVGHRLDEGVAGLGVGQVDRVGAREGGGVDVEQPANRR